MAALIGFDAFMAVWQALATIEVDGSRDRVVWPKLEVYLRYQRNQLIRTLHAEGLGIDQIRTRLAEHASEVPSPSHIRRLLEDA